MREEGSKSAIIIKANPVVQPPVLSTLEVIRHSHWLLLSRQTLLVPKCNYCGQLGSWYAPQSTMRISLSLITRSSVKTPREPRLRRASFGVARFWCLGVTSSSPFYVSLLSHALLHGCLDFQPRSKLIPDCRRLSSH